MYKIPKEDSPMTFDELLEKRRSVRSYTNRKVEIEILEKLVADSTMAPSAGNEQPWKFILITDKDVIDRISRESKRKILERIAGNPDDYARKYSKILQQDAFNVFYNAPAVILILGKADLKNLYTDCALAACYLMMSAASEGLGTCWVNFATEIHDPALRRELGFPQDHILVAPIAIGYPRQIPNIPRRKAPEILKIIP